MAVDRGAHHVGDTPTVQRGQINPDLSGHVTKFLRHKRANCPCVISKRNGTLWNIRFSASLMYMLKNRRPNSLPFKMPPVMGMALGVIPSMRTTWYISFRSDDIHHRSKSMTSKEETLDMWCGWGAPSTVLDMSRWTWMLKEPNWQVKPERD